MSMNVNGGLPPPPSRMPEETPRKLPSEITKGAKLPPPIMNKEQNLKELNAILDSAGLGTVGQSQPKKAKNLHTIKEKALDSPHTAKGRKDIFARIAQEIREKIR